MRERDNGKAVTEYFIILGADENYRKGEEEKGKQPKVRLYRQIRLKIFTRNAVKSVVLIVVHWKMKEKLHLWDSFVIDLYVTVIHFRYRLYVDLQETRLKMQTGCTKAAILLLQF